MGDLVDAERMGFGWVVAMPTILLDRLEVTVAALDWDEGLLFGRSEITPFSASSLTARAYRLWSRAGAGRIFLSLYR